MFCWGKRDLRCGIDGLKPLDRADDRAAQLHIIAMPIIPVIEDNYLVTNR